MDLATRRALDAINRRFYAAAAAEFSETRSHPWPGWERLLPHIAENSDSLRVLDVGCGNGRFAAFLADHLGERLDYLGIDRSAELLVRAREQNAHLPRARFVCTDALGEELASRVLTAPFDLIVLFGVLHHVPGFESRRSLLIRLADGLAPGGLLAVAAWQFAVFERFQARILPWSELEARTGIRLEPEELEPGDHLLRWGDAGQLRYCHFVDAKELQRLLQDTGSETVESYEADGREGRLNRYVVQRRKP